MKTLYRYAKDLYPFSTIKVVSKGKKLVFNFIIDYGSHSMWKELTFKYDEEEKTYVIVSIKPDENSPV